MSYDIFWSTSAILNIQPTKGTHCGCFVDKFFTDTYERAPHESVSNYVKNKQGKIVFFSYKSIPNKTVLVVVIVYIMFVLFVECF